MSLLKQSAQPLLLATDLDGTFLAGDADARKRLYHLVDAHPDVSSPGSPVAGAKRSCRCWPTRACPHRIT